MEKRAGPEDHASYASLIADHIYLGDEAVSGIISVEGFTDMQLTMESEANLLQHDFGQHAVFRLMPQQMYTMAKQLKVFEARNRFHDVLYTHKNVVGSELLLIDFLLEVDRLTPVLQLGIWKCKNALTVCEKCKLIVRCLFQGKDI